MLVKRVRDPFRQFRTELDRMFETVFDTPALMPGARPAFPALSLREEPDAYYLEAEVPGVAADDLHLAIDGRVLTLSGERKPATPPEGASMHRQERAFGAFERRIELPLAVDADAIDARIENGMLFAKLPKAPEHRPQRIAVRNGSGS